MPIPQIKITKASNSLLRTWWLTTSRIRSFIEVMLKQLSDAILGSPKLMALRYILLGAA